MTELKKRRNKIETERENELPKAKADFFHQLDSSNRVTGESLDKHRDIESANSLIAEKEIGQAFHNS